MTHIYDVLVAVEHIESHTVRARNKREAAKTIRKLIEGSRAGTTRTKWARVTRVQYATVQAFPKLED